MALPDPFDATDCAKDLDRRVNPPSDLSATKTPAALVQDCRSATGPCSFVYGGLDVTIDSDQAWFEPVKPLVAGNRSVRWTMLCSRDRISSRRACSLSPTAGGGGFFIVYANGRRQFLVDTNERGYPNSLATVRIDGNPAQSVREGQPFSVQMSTTLLRAMRAGRVVATRYFDWPYNHAHDIETPLEKFSSIIQFADAVATG